MQTLAISEFKATCLAVLDRVRRTGEPVLVTRRGVPVAQVGPPPPPEPVADWLGSMAGTASEIGDILEPLPTEDWEVAG